MKPIVCVPNDVLITPAKTVTKFDRKLGVLLEEMGRTLIATKRPKGVGLAGPQVGEPYRIFITKPTAKAEIRSFINPEILALTEEPATVENEKEDDKKLEGCLSIPDVWGHVNRAHNVFLRYQDPQGQTHEEKFEGFMATIIQHETDHTNGILFSQRVVEQQGKFYKSSIDAEGKEVLEEITI